MVTPTLVMNSAPLRRSQFFIKLIQQPIDVNSFFELQGDLALNT
jgi:hypothetical protein